MNLTKPGWIWCDENLTEVLQWMWYYSEYVFFIFAQQRNQQFYKVNLNQWFENILIWLCYVKTGAAKLNWMDLMVYTSRRACRLLFFSFSAWFPHSLNTINLSSKIWLEEWKSGNKKKKKELNQEKIVKCCTVWVCYNRFK